MIPIKQEPKKLGKIFGAYEKCIWCDNPTTFWHIKSNTPVCPNCSPKHKVSEIQAQKEISYSKQLKEQ